ncbi:hypothetical protein [Phenylobacterium montanum]|uniref:Transporter n=1 Tax=Phenylobacterium montanum TaxID=2823693 RepID=A0A975G4H4_9CAUL|nr:hypothetical protein [Caulobacter sp. S6]QUD90486.1 hypothetical protein KCG34_11785 [Caulobacter sp. S6]
MTARTILARAALASLAVFVAAAPARAQTTGGAAMSNQDLLQALQLRDQAITALERRVAALEAERRAPQPAPIATLDPPAAPAAQPAVVASQATDDAALQALSRGLVERGALVLPKGMMEISPSLTYSHSISQGLTLVDNAEGVSTVDSQRLSDDGLNASVSAKLGLPWRSQLQLTVPYDLQRDVSALGDGSHRTTTAASIGDVEVELSRQLFVERGWRPDVVLAGAWRFPTGIDPFRGGVAGVTNGGGAHEATVRLTALKSADPMVFFSTLSYGRSLSVHESYGRVQPGEELNWQLGGLLSVSPETSLSMSLVQDFRDRTTVNGAGIAGSDQVSSVLQFGLDQVLTRKLLLDVSLGVGVTRDAPNYTLMVSLPIRLY